jgi:ribosomal silencing factor RsfS
LLGFSDPPFDVPGVGQDLFGPEEREHYRLEDVWEKGVETVRIQ